MLGWEPLATAGGWSLESFARYLPTGPVPVPLRLSLFARLQEVFPSFFVVWSVFFPPITESQEPFSSFIVLICLYVLCRPQAVWPLFLSREVPRSLLSLLSEAVRFVSSRWHD